MITKQTLRFLADFIFSCIKECPNTHRLKFELNANQALYVTFFPAEFSDVTLALEFDDTNGYNEVVFIDASDVDDIHCSLVDIIDKGIRESKMHIGSSEIQIQDESELAQNIMSFLSFVNIQSELF